MTLYGHLLSVSIVLGTFEKQVPRQDYCRIWGKHTHEGIEEKAGEGKEDLQTLIKV